MEYILGVRDVLAPRFEHDQIEGTRRQEELMRFAGNLLAAEVPNVQAQLLGVRRRVVRIPARDLDAFLDV